MPRHQHHSSPHKRFEQIVFPDCAPNGAIQSMRRPLVRRPHGCCEPLTQHCMNGRRCLDLPVLRNYIAIACELLQIYLNEVNSPGEHCSDEFERLCAMVHALLGAIVTVPRCPILAETVAQTTLLIVEIVS